MRLYCDSYLHACRIYCFKSSTLTILELIKQIDSISKTSKRYGSVKWVGFTYLKVTKPLRRDSLLLTTKSPGIPDIHLTYLGRIKD